MVKRPAADRNQTTADAQSVTDYPSSVTGSARRPFENGKLFGVRETTPSQDRMEPHCCAM